MNDMLDNTNMPQPVYTARLVFDEGAAVVAYPDRPRKHAHYYKPCPYAEVDVYRVLKLFDVTDQCIGHALKKLLVAGGRGAGKDVSKDVQEAIDSLLRWQEMRAEEATPPQR